MTLGSLNRAKASPAQHRPVNSRYTVTGQEARDCKVSPSRNPTWPPVGTSHVCPLGLVTYRHWSASTII